MAQVFQQVQETCERCSILINSLKSTYFCFINAVIIRGMYKVKANLMLLVLVDTQEWSILEHSNCIEVRLLCAMVAPGTFNMPAETQSLPIHIFCSEKYSFGPTRIRTHDLLISRQELSNLDNDDSVYAFVTNTS